jgi:hypothetical protein
MKKNSIFYFFIFTILLGLQSCATDPLLRSHIVGNWQPVSLGSLDVKKLWPSDGTVAEPTTPEDNKMLIDLRQGMLKPDANGIMQKFTGEDFSRLISEATTSYRFTSDGAGARVNPEHPMKGEWKLNKKGTKLTLTNPDTKEKFILLIDSLSSNKMVATNKNLPNGLKVTYSKGN